MARPAPLPSRLRTPSAPGRALGGDPRGPRGGQDGPVIYVDTSVALAHLPSGPRRPPDSFWSETLVASRLLEVEGWNRLHASGRGATHGEPFREVLGRLALLEMNPAVLARAIEPFPTRVRTLDAIHLASALFLTVGGTSVSLATYDARQADAARALGLRVVEP